VTAARSTTVPWPGTIFVFGPAFAITALRASNQAGSEPPLPRSISVLNRAIEVARHDHVAFTNFTNVSPSVCAFGAESASLLSPFMRIVIGESYVMTGRPAAASARPAGRWRRGLAFEPHPQVLARQNRDAPSRSSRCRPCDRRDVRVDEKADAPVRDLLDSGHDFSDSGANWRPP